MQPETTDEKFEILEGTISDFHWDRGTVNLLEQIQKNSTAKNAAAGAAAAAAGLHGIVASSAMLVLYDGEDVENFVCRIGDNVVCGQFSGADHLKNGDAVKAIVTKQGDLYRADAILRKEDEVLWMPVGSYMGRNADLKGNMRIAMWLCFFVYIAFFILGYYLLPLASDKLFIMLLLMATPPLLTFPVALWVHKDTRVLALRAEKLFTALGFPYHEDLNMNKSSYYYFKPSTDDSLGTRTMSMFYYKKAIEFEKQRRIKKKLPLQDSTPSS